MSCMWSVPLDAVPGANEIWSFGSSFYLVREGDDGAIKVGVASHPMRRLADHQVENPRRLHLVAVFAGKRSDCLAVERLVLSILNDRIVRGEWLNAEPREILDALRFVGERV